MTRRLASALALLTVCALALSSGPARAQPLEYAVKAAFLTKFPAFVGWPAEALRPGEPLRICAIGDDPFAGALEQNARGRSIGDHPLEVRHMPVADRSAGCHVAFAAGSTRQSPAQILQALRGAPVLTVTDASEGGARGVIHFVVFQERVRFHIDAIQATQDGLTINSKLLALALSVKR